MSHSWSKNDSDEIGWQCKHCGWSVKIRDGRHPLQLEGIVKRYLTRDSVGRLPLMPEFKQFHDDNGDWQECTNTDSQLLYLEIDNFKSLVDFSLPLAKFNCLIGLNGAGKTTLLQALDFMSQVMAGQVKQWLRDRDWTTSDLNCRMLKKQLISLEVIFALPSSQLVKWEASFNPKQMRCTSESVVADGRIVLKVADGQVSVAGERFEPIAFDYQGSVLSQLKASLLDKVPVLTELKAFIVNIKSLELLSPHLMRQRARDAADIGTGGEKLSAFLHSLPVEGRTTLIENLKEFYPHLKEIQTSTLRSGWKKLVLRENFASGLETEARHINDGMLRLLAILAQTKTDHSFLLFDEIENGINPELIEKLVQQLLAAPQQVMVTTHSPMILNYLPDEVAKESVILLYKTRQGITRCKRYFDIPDTANKLKALGPGEVFVDTDLTALVQQLEQAETPQ